MNHRVARFIMTVAVALAACFLSAVADGVDTDAYAKKIVFSVNAGAAVPLVSGSTELENFPVLVRLSQTAVSGFSYSDIKKADHSDILFTDDDGTVLPYEIQTWNPSGESLIWVKVPLLASGSRLTMRYGNTDANVVNDPTAVWSEYVVVLHYEEAADSTETTCMSATGDNDGAAKANTKGMTNGPVGNWRDNMVDRVTTSGCGIQLPSYNSLGLAQSFTFTTWVNHHVDQGVYYDHLLMCNNGYGVGEGVLCMLLNNTTELVCSGKDSGWEGWFSAGANRLAMDGTWQHCGLVFDQANVTMVVDGAVQASGSMARGAVAPSDLAVTIGSLSDCGDSSNPWKGGFDESRIRCGTSSSEWIRAEYVSMADAQALLNDGAQENSSLSVGIRGGTAHCVRNSDGTVTVGAALTPDSGATVKAVFNGTLELSIGAVAAGETFERTFAESDFGETAADWACTIVAEATAELTASAECAGVFMTGGEVLVETVGATADEKTLAPGTIRIVRPATAVTHALPVELAVAGTAAKDVVYTMETSLVFAVGQSVVVVPVTPIKNHDVMEDQTVSVTVSPGAYAVDANPAVVTIIDDRWLESAPEIITAFAVNGRLFVWQEDFSGVAADYVLESWDAYAGVWREESIRLANNRPVNNHDLSDNWRSEAALATVRADLRGVTRWRLGRRANDMSSVPWAEFAADARQPVGGTPIEFWSYSSNDAHYMFDAEPDTYFLTSRDDAAYGYYENMWAGIDFGEERIVRGFSFLPNGASGFYVETVEKSDDGNGNVSYVNPQIVYTTTAAQNVKGETLREVIFPSPVRAQCLRVRPIAEEYNKWFSLWELEFTEALAVSGDPSTGAAVVTTLKALTEERGVAVLRSKSADGVFQKIGEIARGATSYADSGIMGGATYWYKVSPLLPGGGYAAEDCPAKSYVKEYQLDRDLSVSASVLREGLSLYAEAHAADAWQRWEAPASAAFDGDESTAPNQMFNWGGGVAYYNSALGIGSGRKDRLFATRCRVKIPAGLDTYTLDRINGLAVYGSNSPDDPPAPGSVSDSDWNAYFTAFASGSDQISTTSASGVTADSWIEFVCTPGEGYRYIYLFNRALFDANPDSVRGDLRGWSGRVAEVQFFGYGSGDLAKPGFMVIVR